MGSALGCAWGVIVDEYGCYRGRVFLVRLLVLDVVVFIVVGSVAYLCLMWLLDCDNVY